MKEDPDLRPARLALVFAAFAAIAAAVWWEELIGRAAPFYDMLFMLFYPNCEFIARCLRSLDFPFWNPHLYCGVPFLANLQSALFYPSTYLFAWKSFPTALSWTLELHTALAGVFMFACARRLGLSRSAAFFSGLVFALNGWFQAHYAYTSNFTSYVWLPLAFYFILDAWEGRTERFGAAAACLAFQIFAGHPAFILYSSATLVLLACFEDRRRRLAIVAAALGLAGVLAAVQLVPSLELALHSVRASGIGLESALVASVAPKEMLTMLLGPQWDLYFMPSGGDPRVMGFYFGPIVLLAAAFAFKEKSARWAPFAAAAALGAILALGSHFPLYKLLYDHVWPFSWFRFPAQALYMVCFAISILAGIGFDRLPLKRVGRALLIALCALDLGLFARRSILRVDANLYTAATPIRDALLQKAGYDHVITSPRTRETYAMPGRTVSEGWLHFKDVLHSNLGMAYGFYMADGQEQMRDRRYETVLNAIDADPLSPWMDVAGIRYVVTLGALPEKFKLLGRPFAGVFENPSAFPKAYFAPASVYVPDADALDYVSREGSRSLLGRVLVNDRALELHGSVAGARVAVFDYAPERVSLETNSLSAGWIVLTDAYDPGWSARVNGTAAAVERVNYFERGVRVPAGSSLVEFSYSPPWFGTACAASVLGWVFLLALNARARRRAKEIL